MSVNNIFLIVVDPPYKRYVKTVPSSIGGIRLNSEGTNTTEFVLRSHPDGFVYDDEVLEIYTDREDRFLRQSNKTLFQKGYLKEYIGEQPQLDTSNMLTDSEIEEIASIRNVAVLQKRLNEITSILSMKRILDLATEIGRPAKTLQIIKKRHDDLKEE